MQHGTPRIVDRLSDRISIRRSSAMPGKHTSKEKRKARHIEKGYEKKGVSHREAEHRAWATVNKQDK
jgi:hypothetical protein